MKQKQALTDEKDSVFMTQEQKDNFNSAGMDQPNNGDSFKQAELIPISHTDVHKFIQEISGDNLQLINFTNEEIEAKDALTSQNNEEFELLQKQIVQTQDTCRKLEERKRIIMESIAAKSQSKDPIPLVSKNKNGKNA